MRNVHSMNNDIYFVRNESNIFRRINTLPDHEFNDI